MCKFYVVYNVNLRLDLKFFAKIQQILHICKRSGIFLTKKAIYRVLKGIKCLSGARSFFIFHPSFFILICIYQKKAVILQRKMKDEG